MHGGLPTCHLEFLMECSPILTEHLCGAGAEEIVDVQCNEHFFFLAPLSCTSFDERGFACCALSESQLIYQVV